MINVLEFELVTSELGGKLDGENLRFFPPSAEYMKQVYDLAKAPERVVCFDKHLRTYRLR